MSLIDLLRMSSGNLKAQKTQDFSDCSRCGDRYSFHCRDDFTRTWHAEIHV